VAEADWFSAEMEVSKPVQLHKQYWQDDGMQCSDFRLGLLVHVNGFRNQIGVHVPSLFYHVGEDSLSFPSAGLKHQTQNLPVRESLPGDPIYIYNVPAKTAEWNRVLLATAKKSRGVGV